MNGKLKMMKSCDQCKTRKVRCSGADHDGATTCTNCARRNDMCHFRPLRKPRRNRHVEETDETPASAAASAKDDDTVHHSDTDGMVSGLPKYDGLQELYVDRLLASSAQAVARHPRSVCLQGLGVFGNEYSLTFFSEARLSTLITRLGHDRVSQLRAKVTSIISERLRSIERVPAPAAETERSRVYGMDQAFIASCIESYFDHVHPVYPFLDRIQFEAASRSPQLGQRLISDKAWSALFYTVLALGSQYHDGGSYQPAENIAWRFFSTALALFPDLLITRATLVAVQAIAAMAIYALNVSCLQFEYAMISEGAKKAQSLGYNRMAGRGDDPKSRTFWVLYCLEKTMTVTLGRSSTIMDSDISSPISPNPLPQYGLGDFDWTLASIKHSRLLSRIFSSLYSVSVRGRTPEYYKATIARLRTELEVWRMTIPPTLRPGEPIRPHSIRTPQMMNVCVRLHHMYHITMLHLNRDALQLEAEPSSSCEEITNVMCTSRAILELTKYIDVQPYTPLWILAAIPLAALLVLFDLIIDNPTHPDTNVNLAMLDIGSGHFSRMEYASQGKLPGSIISEFAHIAREFVRERSSTSKWRPPVDSLATESTVTTILENATHLRPDPSTQEDFVISEPIHNNWNMLDTSEGLMPGTDILDLFGSYFPSWEEDWNLGVVGG